MMIRRINLVLGVVWAIMAYHVATGGSWFGMESTLWLAVAIGMSTLALFASVGDPS